MKEKIDSLKGDQMSIKKHHVKSKLAVVYQLIHTPGVADYIPETELLNKSSLQRMIQKYEKVYLKPDRGRKSKGVIRVERLKGNRFKIRYGSLQKYADKKDIWKKTDRLTKGKRYIVQQAIESVTKDRRHFDLRCHLVRIQGQWKVGGICGRLGEPGSIVTTYHSGGTPTPLNTLLTRHLNYSGRKKENMIRRLKECAIQAVHHVSKMYPNLKEFAVDMGIDPKRRIWIYEVNIEPLIRANFKKLPDKTVYRKIKKVRKIAR
ncbi:YheC/D-like protein [Melghirimyces profundicolus]|uniref:YheC/D-like protein n=1 Tax=Melghirimyces profundicolus TaxID=1242148 RepID=A0A2T6BW96_9BACL|nr:YheC/YheD family protein [Melghirimyces profundicolus]PTX60237.1 YheC/D-like protein [Melghirimyces profundicolus]